MTEALFRDDAYLSETPAKVLIAEPRGIALDRTVFYPQGGGQAGDQGALDSRRRRDDPDRQHDLRRRSQDDPARAGRRREPAGRPARRVVARIDWDRRYKRMRAHTALHLLSVVLPYPVTGGSVGDAEGRLDFDSGEAALDKGEVELQAQRTHRARRAA